MKKNMVILGLLVLCGAIVAWWVGKGGLASILAAVGLGAAGGGRYVQVKDEVRRMRDEYGPDAVAIDLLTRVRRRADKGRR